VFVLIDSEFLHPDRFIRPLGCRADTVSAVAVTYELESDLFVVDGTSGQVVIVQDNVERMD
jgi:hypothetical protein